MISELYHSQTFSQVDEDEDEDDEDDDDDDDDDGHTAASPR